MPREEPWPGLRTPGYPFPAAAPAGTAWPPVEAADAEWPTSGKRFFKEEALG